MVLSSEMSTVLQITRTFTPINSLVASPTNCASIHANEAEQILYIIYSVAEAPIVSGLTLLQRNIHLIPLNLVTLCAKWKQG